MSDVSIVQWALGVAGTLCATGIVGNIVHTSAVKSRIAVCETRIDGHDKTLEMIHGQLRRIEEKLDRVIERG